MTTLHRLVVNWSGPQVVGLAVTVLHWDGSDNAAPPVAGVLAAFQNLASALPGGLQVTVPGSGDTIEDTTGTLTGVWTAPGGGTVTGTGQSPAAAGVGGVVSWITGAVINGKKLRGRTFIVPLAAAAYDGNGHLSTAGVTAVQTWANDIMAAGPLAVWHRPTSKGASDGNSYGVGASRVRNKVAFLSSRRD